MPTPNEKLKKELADELLLINKVVETARIALTTRIARTKKNHILYPEKATVEFPEFDPCRAEIPIAIVRIPAIIDMKETTLTHIIRHNDLIL